MSDLRTRLLDALEGVHERAIDYPQWGVTGILIREFTARERQAANEAVTLDNPADPDQVLFRAMLIQRCVTDPDTGTAYADGRLDLRTGNKAIDPRTRTPVFTVADVQSLANGRAALFNTLWDDLLEVAAMSGATFSRSVDVAVRGKRDAGAGDTEPQSETSGDADPGTSDTSE